MNGFGLLTRQRRFVLLATMLCAVAGIGAAFILPSSIYPELKFSRIVVVAQGTSLGAQDQMFAVSQPLEQAVSVVPGLTRLRSRSIRGATELSLLFAPNTDMQVALQQVEARINEVRGDLPAALAVEVQRQLPSLFPIITYNVKGNDPGELYDVARYQIRPALADIPGIGRIDVQGSDIREVEVIASPERLARIGLGYRELAQVIQDGLGVQAVGRVDREHQQALVVVDQQPQSLDDIADVALPGGLRVRDVATVRLGTVDRVTLIRGDGRPSALINIARQERGNTLQLADSVARTMESLRHSLPPGVTLEPVYDQAGLVREAVGSVRDAMFVGALLAVGVLFAFLGGGSITLISALAIPLTMAITVLVMWLAGASFNLMTLGGMAVAIGLVIDDAVVVTENIMRHLGMPGRRDSAVRDAVVELVWPVTSSTLTTVVVFLPLGLLQGVVGQFFKALSVTLVIAVLVSLVLALTVVPLLAQEWIVERTAKERPTGRRWSQRLEKRIEGALDHYPRWLEASLARPRPVVGIAVVLMVVGGVLGRVLPTGFLPTMDEGAFVLDYWTPTGTSLAETDRQLSALEGILAGVPEVEATSRRTGAEMGLFATEQNTGDVVVRLRPASQRSRDIFAVMDDVRGDVDHTLPRLRVEFIQLLSDLINDLAGNATPVEVKLFGEDRARLETYARTLGERLGGIDGLVDLFDGVPDRMPELHLKIDPAAARRLGLTPSDVSAQVDAALLGTISGQLREGERAIGVRVHAPDDVRFDPTLLGQLPIYPPGVDDPTPLAILASFQEVTTEAEVQRENQRQMITVTGGVEGRSLGAVTADVQAVLAATPAPAGVTVVLGGQHESQREAFRSLLLVLALAGLSVVAVMLLQFESFLEPLVILAAAPVSFVGAALLLLLTGTPLNVSSLMGLILLVGLIVKNGIILLDFTRHRMLNEGDALGVALREAAKVRVRPIVMTTLCTLFGLLPLALGLGAGADMQRPLALTVIGGLALSTPITLFLVPTVVLAVRGAGYRLGEAA
ncbi:MAG: efflux RND transporter permease subunit [Gemmatimonadota bacterium]